MKSELVKKFISFSFGGYVAAIISFFTIPVITRLVSPEEYGIFSIVILITNLAVLMIGLGLDQGFVRFFFEEKEENRSGLLYNSLKVPLIIFLICTFFTIIFRKKIGNFIFGEYTLEVVVLLCVYIFFTLINRFSFLIIRMKQRGILLSVCQIIQVILNFFLVLPFFKLYGNNYKTLFIPAILTLIIVTLLTIFLEKKFWSFKNKKITILEKELFKFSFPLVGTMALTWIFQGFDKISIRIYSNLYELGLYAGALKIVGLLVIIQGGFTTFWIPVAYEKYSKNPHEKKFFENANEYISFLMFVAATILLMSKDIIIILLGNKFREAAYIMPTLIMMPIMYTISETTVLGINFSKQSKKHLYISISSALLNILGNILLVPKLGAKGAAISTGFSYILFFYLRTYFSIKLINYNFKLKKIYSITGLLMMYAIYLSFYNNTVLIYSFGVLILGIILISYKNAIKEILNCLTSIIKEQRRVM